ncbi:alpha/beta fold hydrolase [Georgenia sp. TF02-10]|uniref:esterase/lipase family protein n=1 Tax=Georgenia sp. TF02-10 TaxID=2917725 RepID=UPI001FA7B824|nr:alpha/beta fold hydrolase [Georgenia sp. TF02-10]UNX55093.1 alpha/beta fold hydrolase [Georgenia sp. TF02-10]
MDVILVPGLWLDASSWQRVTPALQAAGHTVRPLTMPGVGAPPAQSADIGIADWVDAVVAEVDRSAGPVVLVGHSGGGNVVYGAVDTRPERVARVIFLDTFPPTDGGTISEFPVVDGVVPFPGWDFFDDSDVADLDDATRADVAVAAVPARVPTDPLPLRDERRRRVPATMLVSTVLAEEVREYLHQRPAWLAEAAALERLDTVDLRRPDEPGGHWPQLTRPDAVAAAIVAAIGD